MYIEFIFISIIGLCIGSFLNVIIYRTPYGKDIIFKSSHCTKCEHKLYWWHNIPLISFLLLKGKCHFCKEKISFSYPIIEILTSLIWVLVFYKISFDISSIILASIFSLLLALCIIDIKYKAVPDSINISALTLTFIYGLFSLNFVSYILDMLIVLAIFYLLRFYISYFLKQEAMGEGDIIIGAIMGGLIGLQLGLFGIFLSAMLALPFSIYSRIKGELELPFIPFLAASIFLISIFNEFTRKIILYVIS
jgi:leader peptidase (prepilin peptidase)/N-methyltransferase